jgi:hypothetical protein
MAFVSPRVSLVAAVLISVCVPRLGAVASQSDRQTGQDPVRINPNGTVSVKADDVAVQVLLEALEPACPIQLRLDAKAAARPVSIDVPELAPADAVGAVLKASGLDFAMHTRCGTIAQPALVVVRLAGDGPIVSVSPRVVADDPRLRQVPAELPATVPEPSPDPEKRDEAEKAPAITVIGAPSEQRELAPGEVTGAQLLERLAPQPPSNSPVIELPFTDPNGQPYLQIRPPKANTVMLPFPDANGNPVEVPVPTGPRPLKADFPVYQPDSSGTGKQPATPPAGPANPADARRPGGGESDR